MMKPLGVLLVVVAALVLVLSLIGPADHSAPEPESPSTDDSGVPPAPETVASGDPSTSDPAPSGGGSEPTPESPAGGAVVTGYVRDRDSGAGLAGAVVWLSLEGYRRKEDRKTVTDTDGGYRFEGVPADAFAWPWVEKAVHVEPLSPSPGWRGYLGKAELREQGVAHRFSAEGEVFRRNLPVRRIPVGHQRFVFRFPKGTDIPTEVEFRHTTVVDRKPKTELRKAALDPAEPVVLLKLPVGVHSFRFAAGLRYGSAAGILVSEDGALPDREIEMSEAGRVLVQLVSEDGKPVRRAGVIVDMTVRGPDHVYTLGEATTNADGIAHVTHHLLEREWAGALKVISFHQAGADVLEIPFGHERTPVTLTGAEYVRLIDGAGDGDLVLPFRFTENFPLTLRVVDREDRPVAGVRLKCEWHREKTFVEEEVTSDAEGMVSVRLLFIPSARWWSPFAKLVAQAPWSGKLDYVNWKESGFRPGDPAGVPKLVVYKTRTARFRVTDEEGRPEAKVHVASSATIDKRVETDEEGRFGIVLPTGPQKLSLTVGGVGLGTIDVPAADVETELRIPSRWRLRIRVQTPKEFRRPEKMVGEWKTPVRHNHVWFMRPEQGDYVAETEIRGQSVTVSLVSADRRWAATAEARRGSEEVVLRLARRELHRVVLRFVDKSDSPLRGLGVLFRRDQDPDVSEFTLERMETDADGRLVLELPAGASLGAFRIDGGRLLGGWAKLVSPSPEVQQYRVEMKK